MRRFALVVLSLLAFAAACDGEPEPVPTPTPTPPPEADEEDEADLVIALLRPESGIDAAAGQDVLAGFELYLDDADGRLGGLAVDVVAADEGDEPEEAAELAEGLVDDGAAAVVGLVDDAVAAEVVEVVDWGEAPLVIAGAAADGLTQPSRDDGVFRVAATASQSTLPMGAHVCQELGYAQVALVAVDDPVGWDAAGGFARSYTDAGCEIAGELLVPVDEEDWESFVVGLEDDADAVWAATRGPDSLRFLQAYRDVGPDLPLLGSAGLTDEEVLVQQRALADGVRTAAPYAATLETEENTAFVAAFEAAHGRPPGGRAEAGYAAAQVLDAALAAAGGNPERLAGELTDVVVDAPRGRLAFDEDGQAVHDVHLREVEQVGELWRHAVERTWEEVGQYGDHDREAYLEMTPYDELVDTWALD